MRKLKTLFVFLILFCSCAIFASCQKSVTKIKFADDSPVVLEVGETYEPNIFVSPSKFEGKIELSSSNPKIVVVSPDNKLVAVGIGTAQIEAKADEVSANLVVQVVAKRIKLDTPVGVFYDGQKERIVWSAVNNANAYDVEIDGKIVAKDLSTNHYEISSSSSIRTFRVKAKGINAFSDSDFTEIYKFKNLNSPSSLAFDKTTQTLSWGYSNSNAKFRVCINNLQFDAGNSKTFSLEDNLIQPGEYEVCVVALSENGQMEGDVAIFDSAASDKLLIKRLFAVDASSIVWNASEKLLTWGEIEGAKYEVQIDGQTPVLANENNLTLNDLEKGNHQIKITAVSDDNLVLNATQSALSNVAITKQLSTPIVQSYNVTSNTLTLTNIDEAQNFIILCNNNVIYDGAAQIVEGSATITLSVGVFDNAGEYKIIAKSKADATNFFTQSNQSEPYVITRLAPPSDVRIENGKTLVFNPQANATGYEIFVGGEKHEIEQPMFNLFDLAAGEYEIMVKYLGNNNTILESDNSTLHVTRLASPLLEFDKNTLELFINKDIDEQYSYDITINGNVRKNVELTNNTYSLLGVLKQGENQITVQTVAKANQIYSNTASILITKPDEISGAVHTTAEDVSKVTFDENSAVYSYEVTLDSTTKLDYTAKAEEGKTILTLTKPTSQIFSEAGTHTLLIEARTNSESIVNPAPVQLEITKLKCPTELSFVEPNSFRWTNQEEISNNFVLHIFDEGNNLIKEISTQDCAVSVDELTLGNLKACVKLLGNEQDVLSSDFCNMLNFVHTKTLAAPVVEFNKQNSHITITCSDLQTTKVMVFINATKKDEFDYSSSIIYPLGADFNEAGDYKVKVVATNSTNEFILDAESQLVLTRLSAPTDLKFESEKLTWTAVEHADYYTVVIEDEQYECASTEFSTLNIDPGAYNALVIPKSNQENVLDGAGVLKDFEVKRTLATPTNLKYDKSTNTLTFDAVNFAQNYEIFVNDEKLVQITATNFTFNQNQFASAGEYQVEVRALCDNVYREKSNLSRPLIITRLAAPTEITVLEDESVQCNFDSNKASAVEILINETKTNSLLSFDGEIKIKVKLIGASDNYLDSDYGVFERTRLLAINNIRIEKDKILWDANPYAENYLFSMLFEGDSTPAEQTIEKDTTEKAFDFPSSGNYTLKMIALGDRTTYLNSRESIIQITKAQSPTNVQLEENPETSSVNIWFEDNQEGVLGYEIFVDDQSIGTFEETTKTIDSSLLSSAGEHNIYVVAVGDNANNVVSSNPSTQFITRRLSSPDEFRMSYNYYVTWNAVHSQTEYKVEVYVEEKVQEEGQEEKVQRKVIKQQTSSSNLVWFKDEATSAEFADYEGSINIVVCSLGNNTTLLRSETILVTIPKTPKSELSNDADCVYFSKVDPNSFFEVTILLNGDTNNPIAKEILLLSDQFIIPTNWEAGEYTFIVRQIRGGEFVSGYTTFVKKKLEKVDRSTCQVLRDGTDEDILTLSWAEVENASGYVVAYSTPESEELVELYRGTQNSFVLPSDLTGGRVFFWIKTLGSAEHGFSSNLCLLDDRTKLSSEALNLRNENGTLSWNAVGTSICSGYKIVINGDNEHAIKVDNRTLSHTLSGHSGQLNIKVKAIGKDFGIDSNYAELNIAKLPQPRNVRVVEGKIEWDFDYTTSEGETINFFFDVDGKTFEANEAGIQSMAKILLAKKDYQVRVQARNPELFLNSDKSEQIVVQILESPNANDKSTFISTNLDKTISQFNWSSAVGAAKHEVKIEGGQLEAPVLNVVEDTQLIISGLAAGEYKISVRRIGQTGDTDGVNYLSSGFSSPIGFKVLSAPNIWVENGQLVWESQTGANDYYLYVGEGYSRCGNVTSWSFIDEYKDFTTHTNIKLKLQAIGDGINFLASEQTSERDVIKPRPPQLPKLINGGITWTETDEYSYFDDTQNKRVLLNFEKNGVTADSFEIDVNYLKTGWPLDDNYLQKITTNLPAGEYILRVKQIGDSEKVITSEYSEQTIDIIVAPTPTNVYVDDHKLVWDAVSLENSSQTDEAVYIVYAFDSIRGDWIKLTQTSNTFLDVQNSDGLLKLEYISLAVATRGNTTQSPYLNYMTSNMSEKVDVIVLGTTSNLQTVDGNLTWDIVPNATSYSIISEKGNMIVLGAVNSSILEGFEPGIHNVQVRALGNGSSKSGNCIINGVIGERSTVTKLPSPAPSTTHAPDDKLLWGTFVWDKVENNCGYNVYVNNNRYAQIEGESYESDYPSNERNLYSFQAKGNSVIPSPTNIAYVSSNLSVGIERIRMNKIQNVLVRSGKLYWQSSTSPFSPRIYFVEFYKDTERVRRVPVEVKDNNLVNINNINMVEFDVGGHVQEGAFTVLVREVQNSEPYIAGVESDPIEISKLDAPQEVKLDNGILTWTNVEEASGYIIRIISESKSVDIVEGFSLDEQSNTWSWNSYLESGSYRVSLRAISDDQNKLSSSWTTKFGEMEGYDSPWIIRQIPTLSLGDIDVTSQGYVTWNIPSVANIPENRAYIVWRKGEPSPQNEIVTTDSYPIDENLSGLAVRIIPYEDTLDYFASRFSEFKAITRPDAPTGLKYDDVQQIFTWDAEQTSDTSYIVIYSLDGMEEVSFETSQNKFEPAKPGNYEVAVQVKKFNSSVGISQRSEPATGVFNLFTEGEGTSMSPFLVTQANFENIMFRPNAHFKLVENIDRKNKAPLGFDGSSSESRSFMGCLDGNEKTISVAFEEYQTSLYVGIFGELGDGSKIINLTVRVDGPFNLQGDSYTSIHAGAIAGSMNGENAVIENCKVVGETTISRRSNAETRFGSFVGLLMSGTIKNCISELNINVSDIIYISKVGGIVGMVGTDNSTNAIVESCENKGTIIGANVVGGIAAYNYGTINNCTNFQNLSSNALRMQLGQTTSDSIVGGIVGVNIGKRTNIQGVIGGIISGSQNLGTITACNNIHKDLNSFAGGIVGETNAGKIDQNTSRGQVLISEDNISVTKSSQAIVGNLISYSERSTNYKLPALSQSDITNMTVKNVEETPKSTEN